MTINQAAVIVVGVDGSPQSLSAVDWAAREAAARQYRLRIVHAFLWPLMGVSLEPPVMGPPDAGLQQEAEQLLRTATDRARQIAPALDISTDLPVCAPAAALIDASRDAALVVVGHRGLGGFTGLLVGSVGVQTAAHAACPVVVVRDSPSGGPDETGPATGQVVVGVDGSDLSNLAVDFAFAYAALHRLGVVAVHAYQWRIGSYYTDYLYQWPTRLLAEAVAECREKYPDVPVQQKAVQGESTDVLVAESAGAALTVVGSRGRGGFTGLLLGSTSQRVLHHATGTVAIVRAQATHGGDTTRPRQDVSDAPEPAHVATGPTAPVAPHPAIGTRPAARDRTGAEAADTGAPPVSSFAKSLFTGRLPATMVMPYPQLTRDEQRRVDGLIGDARDFLDASYDPIKVEQERWVGDNIVRGLGERGLLGLYVAPEYGGQGLSQTGYCRVMEEFGGYDGSLSVVMGVHQSIGMKPIHLFGSDEQKARFLPDLAAGRKLAGFALTEPGAGSDMRGITAYAERQADGSYVLNGEKRWIGNGGKDVVCVFARAETGHVALIVEKGMPGFDAPDRYDTLGLRGNDLRRLTFRDVRVPKENVLGEPGDGLRVAMHTLNNGRMSLGTGVVGATKRLIDLAIDHTTRREQFGRPLAEFELVEDKISWMVSYLYGFESMAYLTTGLVDAGVPDYSVESAMAKIAGSEFHWYAVNRVFQLLGGQAYMADSPAAKALRDSRVFSIFEGANDVLRAFVALAGLKTVADEVTDLRHLNLTDPIGSIGILADYAGQRLRRRVRPDRLDTAHPTLGRHADRVAGQVGQLRATAEKLLRIHGPDIQFRQRQQKRLAHAAIDIYAQIATISRTSALFDVQGVQASGQERYIATTFCDRAGGRVAEQFDRVDDNDDEQTHAIARLAHNRGGYTLRLP
ncbi:universal stress protein [Nonomuraea guangzhouensis]|uniref:Universal stress protein n=1 Tax=Nonomuraea guangzhouensis TaxID=1291555 RepID=A0ABW4GQE0_9ACTN|nr:universal stress protein [Nonomuraea guangzhouensis]